MYILCDFFFVCFIFKVTRFCNHMRICLLTYESILEKNKHLTYVYLGITCNVYRKYQNCILFGL